MSVVRPLAILLTSVTLVAGTMTAASAEQPAEPPTEQTSAAEPVAPGDEVLEEAPFDEGEDVDPATEAPTEPQDRTDEVVVPDNGAGLEEAPQARQRTTARAAGPNDYVSLVLNSDTSIVRTGENFWLRGKVTVASGAVQKNVAVRIYRYTGSGRVLSQTVRTNGSGIFSWSPPGRSNGTYLAKVTDNRYSAKLTIKATRGTRTLASRATAMAFMLGSPRGGVNTQDGRTWRSFDGGVLMKNGGRTYLVRGRAADELRARRAAGPLGVPTGDARCGLPEAACLQQFTRGAIYSNSRAQDTVTSAVGPFRGAADLVAVALSQVGYREPAYRKSKYNKWIGMWGTGAWCGFFQGWVSHAAGKGKAILKVRDFDQMVAAEKRRGRTSSTPRVGRLAYFKDGTGHVYHVGLVSKVTSTTISTVEGNTGPRDNRGVAHNVRSRSSIAFYADPYYD